MQLFRQALTQRRQKALEKAQEELLADDILTHEKADAVEQQKHKGKEGEK